MQINLYDILSKLIPGGVLYSTFFYFNYQKDRYEYLTEALALVLIYFAGYVVDAISSFLERDLLFPSFGGDPAQKMLKGQGFMQIKIARLDQLQAYFAQQLPSVERTRMFSYMHSLVSKKGYKRLEDFHASYIFSRNILTSLLLSGFMYIAYRPSWTSLFVISTIVFFTWLRAKQRNYYFVKEVINTFIYEKLDSGKANG
jgi:hypothetical protein